MLNGEGKQRIVVTGIGALSSVGIGASAFWSNLLAGTNGIRPITQFDTSEYRTHNGGEVQAFTPLHGTAQMGRASQFAVHAIAEAIEDAGIDISASSAQRVGLSIGTTMGESQMIERVDRAMLEPDFRTLGRDTIRRAVPEAITTQVAAHFRLRGPVNLFTNACAAGNFAFGHAMAMLRTKTVDVMIAGGTDPLSQIAYIGFNSMMAIAPERCQPFDRHRKGMCPAEGCGMLVIETMQHALDRGAQIYAEIAGCGISNDAYHMTAPHPQARGAIRAMDSALTQARVSPGSVDYISAHGTGTMSNDKIETIGIRTVFESTGRHIPSSSIKSMLGHSMGAASALEAIACILAIRDSVVPPTINYDTPDPDCDVDCVPNLARELKVRVALSNAYALGGHCSALLLKSMN